jgi:hypothetical protein
MALIAGYRRIGDLTAERNVRVYGRPAMNRTVQTSGAWGESAEGEALILREGFNPKFDLYRASGLSSRPGHTGPVVHREGQDTGHPCRRVAWPPVLRCSTFGRGRLSRGTLFLTPQLGLGYESLMNFTFPLAQVPHRASYVRPL